MTESSSNKGIQLGSLMLHTENQELNLIVPGKRLTVNIAEHSKIEGGQNVLYRDQTTIKVKWNSKLTLLIARDQKNGIETYHITWYAEASAAELLPSLIDSIPLTDQHWYGGPEVFCQHWPISNISVPLQPYISKDMVANENPVYGSFVERYFLNSQGISVVICEETPLWVGINEMGDQKIRLMSKYSSNIFPSKGRKSILLKYDIILGKDVKAVHQYTMREYFRRPVAIPDERMFKFPIWSTWAKYKQNIDQKSVMEFAKSICDNGFPNSQLEIDDMWSTRYGDVTFDGTKFPDAKDMIRKLKDMGFRVTVWTTPFLNVESENVRECLDHRWIRDGPSPRKEASMFVRGGSETPALIKWWNGFGAMVDFTNPEAVNWFIEKHNQLRHEVLLDSFKFDAGEAEFLPSTEGTSKKLENPLQFTTAYVECVSKFGGMVEVRSGYKTQHLPVFVRMMDKDSGWSHANGLRSLIPTCLTLSILGYPFVLPDMIGGNCYHGEDIPGRELFIRWIEISAFMPAMQFSVVPWQYDEEIVGIARRYVDLHAFYVTPIILKYARLSTTEDGCPIVRPIWWLDPSCSIAHSIDDEFLIGDELLVAPIVHAGKTSRNIFFPGPSGRRWKDERSGKVFQSASWVNDYDVPLQEIAYFKILRPEEST